MAPAIRSGRVQKKLEKKKAQNPGVTKQARKNDYSERTIEFTVGGSGKETETKLLIHPGLVFTHSPYLKNLLEGDDGKPKTFHHKDLRLDGNAVIAFADYCYTDQIEAFAGKRNNPGDVLDQTLDLWFLGKKLEVIRLQNQAIDKAALAMRTHDYVLSVDHIRRIYKEETSQDSVLRRFIVDQYAWARDCADLSCLDWDGFQSAPRRFGFDLLDAMSLRHGKGKNKLPHDNPNEHPERYHVQAPIIEVLDSDGEDDRDVIRLDSPGLFVD